jgi:hypothetical protein
MANTFIQIATVSVPSNQATISFSVIPSTYTDLVLKMSTRSSGQESGNTWDNMSIQFNGSSASFTARDLYGLGASAGSGTFVTGGMANGNNATSSTFSSVDVYIPNYAGSNNKSFLVDAVTENNSTVAIQNLTAGLWSNTAAITSITFGMVTNSYVTNSTATLYGISKS